MNKATRRILILAAVIPVLLVLLVIGGNRLIFHRSFNATVFEWELRQSGRDSLSEDPEHWLKVRADINKKHIRLPEDLKTPYQFFTYGDERMECYLFIPENYDADRLAVYFCGGTFLDIPSELHWSFIDTLAQDTGCRVLVPIYPKLPKHGAADACDTLCGFYAECVQNMDCDRVLFLGDSAGGGLALSLAQTMASRGMDGPDGMILLSPWLDVSMSNPAIADYADIDPKLDAETLRFAGSLWAGDGSVTETPASPLYGELSGLCPVTVFVGSRELLYPDALVFAEKAAAAGLDCELVVGRGMNHVWPLYQRYHIKESETVLRQIEALVTAP